MIPLASAGERSLQELLAERRANVQEQRRETDPIAIGLLQYHIDEIDREIARRNGGKK